MVVRTPLSEEENHWIKQVALRLRAVQADLAGQAPERRRERLREELRRGCSSLPAESRKRCLEVLLSRFPIDGLEEDQGLAGSGAGAAVAPSVPAPAARTPEQLVSAFLESAKEWTDGERGAVAKTLAEAGFNWLDRDALVLEVTDEFRQGLGLTADQQPRLSRVVQLCLVLIELLNRLDNMALKTLGELSPRSALLTRPQEFREAVASYLTGANDSVESQLRAMSGLLGGLLAAMLGAGRDYGRQYVERFSPSSIEDVVKGEGKVGLFGNEKALCWDKYRDLAKEYATPDMIDRRIKESLGTFVEKKVSAAR